MKRMILAAMVLSGVLLAAEEGSSAGPLPAAGQRNSILLPPESVAISTGEVRKFEVPFVVEEFKSSTGNARVLHVEGRAFEIEGVAVGNAVVSVSATGISKEFRVTVSSSVMPIYRELSRELGDLPEVGVELSDNVLTLRGEITKTGHWEYFRRVVKRYEDRCRNYVSFQPGPALFEELKKQFEAAGFKVADQVSPELPGQIRFQVANGVLTVSGYLLCEDDIAMVKRILASRKWLSPEWNGNALRAVTELKIADTQLDVGIVFVGVTRTQLERLGNASADGTLLSWNLIAWFRALAGGVPPGISDASNGNGLYSYFNTDLKGSLVAFGNNGISDFRDAGHVTLTNNSPNFASYENGGTLNVKVYGQETADLKPINFGLKIKAAFDIDETKCGAPVHGKPVYPIRDLKRYVRQNGIIMGILTVSESGAQPAADALVEAGIQGIWNFSPAQIDVPDSIFVQQEDLAAGLAVLAVRIKERQ